MALLEGTKTNIESSPQRRVTVRNQPPRQVRCRYPSCRCGWTFARVQISGETSPSCVSRVGVPREKVWSTLSRCRNVIRRQFIVTAFCFTKLAKARVSGSICSYLPTFSGSSELSTRSLTNCSRAVSSVALTRSKRNTSAAPGQPSSQPYALTLILPSGAPVHADSTQQ